MHESEARELLEKDEEGGEAYVSDKYLLEASQNEFNFKADNEVALGLETGRDMIYGVKKDSAMTPAQATAVNLYNSANVSARGNSSNGRGDVVVSKVSVPVETPAVESIDDNNDKISKLQKDLLIKLIDSTVSSTEKVCDSAISAFEHYAKQAVDIQKDLRTLKRNIEKQIDQVPMLDLFEFGAYSRFFMTAGKPITEYSEFSKVFGSMKSALQFSLFCGIPLAQSNARTCLNGLRRLQVTGTGLSADEYEQIVDRIRDDTLDVWKNAAKDNPHMVLADYEAKTPSSMTAGGPKTVGPIGSYFDNNVLLWHAPIDYNFMESSKIQRVDFFGASLTRDLLLDKVITPSERPKGFYIPTNKDLIATIDIAIEALSIVQKYKVVASDVKAIKSELTSSLEVLTKLAKADEPTMAVRSYSPLVAACMQGFTQPHIKLVWLVIRASIMLAAIAETSFNGATSTSKYATLAKNAGNKIILKLDIDVEPEQEAAKELGYFTTLLLKLKKSK